MNQEKIKLSPLLKFSILLVIAFISVVGFIGFMKETNQVEEQVKDTDAKIEVEEIVLPELKKDEVVVESEDKGTTIEEIKNKYEKDEELIAAEKAEEDLHDHSFIRDMESEYQKMIGKEKYQETVQQLKEFAVSYYTNEWNVEEWGQHLTEQALQEYDVASDKQVERKVHKVLVYPIVGEGITFEIKVEYGSPLEEQATDEHYLEVMLDKESLKISEFTIL